jgi:uncharacterized protein
MNTTLVYRVAVLILIIAGLNLGLIGAFHFDAMGHVLGAGTSMAYRVFDIVVGVAALIKLYAMFVAKK